MTKKEFEKEKITRIPKLLFDHLIIGLTEIQKRDIMETVKELLFLEYDKNGKLLEFKLIDYDDKDILIYLNKSINNDFCYLVTISRIYEVLTDNEE